MKLTTIMVACSMTNFFPLHSHEISQAFFLYGLLFTLWTDNPHFELKFLYHKYQFLLSWVAVAQLHSS